MKISFIYKNNTFNFDLKRDISIISLKNLVSKMIQKDISSFDLIYENKILSENNSTLSQICNNETKIAIIIKPKDNKSNKYISMDKKIKLPLLLPSNQIYAIKTESDDFDNNNLKLNLKENKFSSSSSMKDCNKYKNGNTDSFALKTKIKYITRNKVFEDIYNQKEENIFNLLRDLKYKILEYDNILYNNYKNKYNDNNKLLLFEKNVINFKDRQIQYLKKLVNYFDKTGTSLISEDKINLEEFYQELSCYNNKKNKNSSTFTQNYSMKKEKNIFNNNNNLKTMTFNEVKISTALNIKNKEDNIPKKNKQSKDSFDNDNDKIIEEKREEILLNNKQKKEKFRPIYLKKSLTNKNLKNLNDIINEKPTVKKENGKKVNHVISESDGDSNEENTKNEKINEKRNYAQIQSSKSITDNRKFKSGFDKNKIGALFEIYENKQENGEIESESDDDSNVDNVKYQKKRKKEVIERNLKERKKTMIIPNKTRIGYKFKLSDKKTTIRLKKLGNSFSDFLI